MQNNSNLPLHARTHWRRVKELITTISDYEHINLASYKLNNITCYSTCGDSLEGTTVTYNTKGNKSPWVSDNHYDVYEVPAVTNSDRFPFCGSFVFLAHNKSFDYWLFGTLTDKIDYSKTKTTSYLVENVKYTTYGEYTVSAGSNPDDSIVTKVNQGTKVDYGGRSFSNNMFDSFSERKKAFCKKTNSQVLSEILGKKTNSNTNIVDTSQVQKFKKTRKKRK